MEFIEINKDPIISELLKKEEELIRAFHRVTDVNYPLKRRMNKNVYNENIKPEERNGL